MVRQEVGMAASRKLLVICFGVLKTGKLFGFDHRS
jgi:hypothetical protein